MRLHQAIINKLFSTVSVHQESKLTNLAAFMTFFVKHWWNISVSWYVISLSAMFDLIYFLLWIGKPSGHFANASTTRTWTHSSTQLFCVHIALLSPPAQNRVHQRSHKSAGIGIYTTYHCRLIKYSNNSSGAGLFKLRVLGPALGPYFQYRENRQKR